MKHWQLSAIGILLVAIFLLTLYGRWFDCTVHARFGFHLLHSTDEVQGACGKLLNPFQFLR